MNEYEIHIGLNYDIEKKEMVPHHCITISEEQKMVIDMFASTRKDSDLNTVYTLNGVNFKMVPKLNIKQ